MAVRFGATSNSSLDRSTSLPSYATGVTAMGWFKISTDRNNYSTFISLEPTSGASNSLMLTNSDGTTFEIYDGTDNTGSALSVGTWYHLAFTCNTTAQLGYLNGVLDITGAGAVGTLGYVMIGNDTANENLDGCAAYIKVWDAILTATEIQQEMFVIRPVRTANLHLWAPLFPGTSERLVDYSGNARDFTAVGTLSDEDGPPVSYGGSPIIFPFVAAAASGDAVPQCWSQYRRRAA